MDDIEVPEFFLCPISLEIMKDPVTLSTGITYDRKSIEKWIFSGENNTFDPNSDSELTPNHTLRRVIQSWCTLNPSYIITRIPTPRPPIDNAQILKLINQSNLSQCQMRCLQTPEFLASIINKNGASGEAISILYHLQLSETGLKSLIGQNGEFLNSITRVMKGENNESRTYAVLLLMSIFDANGPRQVFGLKGELFSELVKILRDQICEKASKAALKVLINICPWGRNKAIAVQAGAVPVLIDILIDSFQTRICEMVLMVLDMLCQCAGGRAELLNHGAGLAVVSKKILGVSQVGSDRAVMILFSISKFSSTPTVLMDMLQLGVVGKLLLVLQARQLDCGNKCKEISREILKLHARAWKNSPCLPMHLISSYPS